jgi:hypothetical protein
MMEAIRSSETSVLTRAAGRHIPEDGILRGHRRENLIFYKRYIAGVHSVRPVLQESGPSTNLQHDDAPAHSLAAVTEFLTTCWIPMLSHAPYSSDLGPDGFFSFLN